VVAVILAGGEGRRLLPLTLQRAKPAVPFAGSYRLIDFTLSNCINSGIRRIVVITEYQAESVVNHLRPLCSLLRNRGIELLSVCSSGDGSWCSTNGTAGAVFKNLRSILASDPDDILVLSSDHIYRMDYSAMLDFHRRAGSEATVACTNVELSLASSFGILSVDGRGVVFDFEEKPNVPKALPGEPSKACASMGIYLFKRDSLVQVLKQDALTFNSKHDFGKDIIRNLYIQNRLHAYNFADNGQHLSSYWRDVGTIDTYFQASMDILEPTRFPLHDPHWPLYTSRAYFKRDAIQMVPRQPPAASSLVSVECEIRTRSIERSVISPGVAIGEDTQLVEVVVFPRAKVGNNVRARRCIIEEGAVVPDNTWIGYDEQGDRDKHMVSRGGVVVVRNKQIIGGDNEDSNSGSRQFGQRVFGAV
jgi:glucose-1-phosphate adenylyltransferase